MADIYVFSTLTCDQRYTSYRTDASGVPKATASVFIAGGANLMTKQFVTPLGTATKVTAEQLKELEQNEMFKIHKANGFITVSESKANADEVAADMTGRDQSAPIVEQDDEFQAPAAEAVEAPRRGRPRKG